MKKYSILIAIIVLCFFYGCDKKMRTAIAKTLAEESNNSMRLETEQDYIKKRIKAFDVQFAKLIAQPARWTTARWQICQSYQKLALALQQLQKLSSSKKSKLYDPLLQAVNCARKTVDCQTLISAYAQYNLLRTEICEMLDNYISIYHNLQADYKKERGPHLHWIDARAINALLGSSVSIEMAFDKKQQLLAVKFIWLGAMKGEHVRLHYKKVHIPWPDGQKLMFSQEVKTAKAVLRNKTDEQRICKSRLLVMAMYPELAPILPATRNNKQTKFDAKGAIIAIAVCIEMLENIDKSIDSGAMTWEQAKKPVKENYRHLLRCIKFLAKKLPKAKLAIKLLDEELEKIEEYSFIDFRLSCTKVSVMAAMMINGYDKGK